MIIYVMPNANFKYVMLLTWFSVIVHCSNIPIYQFVSRNYNSGSMLYRFMEYRHWLVKRVEYKTKCSISPCIMLPYRIVARRPIRHELGALIHVKYVKRHRPKPVSIRKPFNYNAKTTLYSLRNITLKTTHY